MPWTERLEIYGSNGAVIVDHLLDQTAVLYQGPDEKIEKKVNEAVPYEPQMWKFKSIVAEVKGFLEAVKDNREPFIHPEDGLYSIKVAEAASQSVEMGQAVALS